MLNTLPSFPHFDTLTWFHDLSSVDTRQREFVETNALDLIVTLAAIAEPLYHEYVHASLPSNFKPIVTAS